MIESFCYNSQRICNKYTNKYTQIHVYLNSTSNAHLTALLHWRKVEQTTEEKKKMNAIEIEAIDENDPYIFRAHKKERGIIENDWIERRMTVLAYE